jgi:hypothetical protein
MKRAIAAIALMSVGTSSLAPLANARASAEAAQTRVIERTLLKAKPGRREQLARYIEANWFAMDRIGVQQGLFTSYRLLENTHEHAEWDLVVEVGYPNAEGFEAPSVQQRFDAIRAAHRTIPIDGQGLAELGAIIRSERVRPREEF